jgi:hypothetical protein
MLISINPTKIGKLRPSENDMPLDYHNPNFNAHEYLRDNTRLKFSHEEQTRDKTTGLVYANVLSDLLPFAQVVIFSLAREMDGRAFVNRVHFALAINTFTFPATAKELEFLTEHAQSVVSVRDNLHFTLEQTMPAFFQEKWTVVSEATQKYLNEYQKTQLAKSLEYQKMCSVEL